MAMFMSMGMSCGGNGGGDCDKALEGGVWSEIVTACTVADMTPEQLIAAGKEGLVQNEAGDAVEYLAAVPSGDAAYGEAQYGLMLTDLQLLMGDVDSLLGMIMSLTSMTSVNPQAPVDLWSMLGSMIEPIQQKLESLDTRATAVLANGYTLSTDETVPYLPLVLGEAGTDYYIDIKLQGQAGDLPARALKLIANLGVGIIEIVAAHDLSLDLTSAMANLEDLMVLLDVIMGNADEDVVKLLRGLGWLWADNPNLLAKSATRWNSNMSDVPDRLIAAIESLRELDADLVATASSTGAGCVDVVCLVSSDVAWNEGDGLRINGQVHVEIAMELDADMLDLIDSVAGALGALANVDIVATAAGLTVDIDLTNNTLVSLTSLILDPIAAILDPLDTLLVKVEDSITDGYALSSVEVNPVLSGLTLPTFPDGLATLSVKPLFSMPIRSLASYFECNENTVPTSGGGKYCIGLEVELDDCTGYTFCSTTDAGHFDGMSGGTPAISAIAADGVAPVADNPDHLVPTSMLPYVALGDPSLNGALKIDLSKLDAAETAGLAAATNYSLWKMINWTIVTYVPDVEESDLMSSLSVVINPIADAVLGATGLGN